MGTHPIFESDFDCLTECCVGLEQVDGRWEEFARPNTCPWESWEKCPASTAWVSTLFTTSSITAVWFCFRFRTRNTCSIRRANDTTQQKSKFTWRLWTSATFHKVKVTW